MERKVSVWIKEWERRCYTEGLPDESPIEIKEKVPSYKRIAMAILNNDHSLQSLGFSQPKSAVYNELKRIEIENRIVYKKQTMILQTSELRNFKAKAVAIPANTLLPIYSYLLLAPGSITKSSGNSFLTMNITYDGAPLLIDEKILMSFVSSTKSPTISVEVSGKQILLSDGITKDESPTDDVAMFTKTETPTEEWATFTDYLIHISSCASMCLENELDLIMSHVYIGNKLISGTDKNIAYLYPTNYEGEIVLSRQTAIAISKLDAAEFSQNSSYHFFKNDACLYGFIKPQAAMVDFKQFIKPLTGLENFTVDKNDFINFNDHAVSSSNWPFVKVAIVTDMMGMKLSAASAPHSRVITREVKCEGSISQPFNYNAAIMNRLLKALPATTITFTRDGQKLYLSNPEFEFVSLIMGLND